MPGQEKSPARHDIHVLFPCGLKRTAALLASRRGMSFTFSGRGVFPFSTRCHTAAKPASSF